MVDVLATIASCRIMLSWDDKQDDMRSMDESRQALGIEKMEEQFSVKSSIRLSQVPDIYGVDRWHVWLDLDTLVLWRPSILPR